MLALALLALNGQAQAADRDVDFRSFAYPFPSCKFIPVPDRLVWMNPDVKSTVTLVDGRHNFDRSEPTQGPSLILDQVHYGYLTSSEHLDAVVVLGYHTGGTAYWYYVYAFSLGSSPPKLVGWLRAGSRADSGLYRIQVSNRRLTLDLFDPQRRVADCCSEGFVRTTYDYKDGRFVISGPQTFGNVEATGPNRPNPE
jgi:hypothetical protein